MAVFVLELAFDQDEEARLAVRPSHREYLKVLFDSGALVMSGPLADDSGALLVYEAPDAGAVEAIVAADPYTNSGGVRTRRPARVDTVSSATSRPAETEPSGSATRTGPLAESARPRARCRSTRGPRDS